MRAVAVRRDIAVSAEAVRRAVLRGLAESAARAISAVPDALRVAGQFLRSEGQRAFREQRLGPVLWPKRYPNTTGGFINVAGALAWLNRGTSTASLPGRMFQDRPALLSTGALQRSVNFSVDRKSVKVGSNLEYAPVHQWGGRSVQEVTSQARAKLARLMRRARRGKLPKAVLRLGFLFRADELETNVAQRPFVGIPRDARFEREVVDGIERTIEAAAGTPHGGRRGRRG